MSSPEIVLLVTATQVESRAVLEIFPQATGQSPKQFSSSGRSYFELGVVESSRIYLALSEMGSGGRGGSQESVRKALDALNPDLVFMVGIAFGIDEQKQSIGEVLVSQQLCLYELQRRGAVIVLRGDKPHASPDLINRCQATSILWEVTKVRIGTVLTGEKLIDDVDYRNQLKALETEVIGGEMEGAGLYVACEAKRKPWIVVKGIGDWADGNKNNPAKDEHQTSAARNAAAFVLSVLQVPHLDTHGAMVGPTQSKMPSQAATGFSDAAIEDCADSVLNFAYYQTEGFTIGQLTLAWLYAYGRWLQNDEASMSINDEVLLGFPNLHDPDGAGLRLDEATVQLALDECVVLGYLETSRWGHSGIGYRITPKGRVRFSRLLVDKRNAQRKQGDLSTGT